MGVAGQTVWISHSPRAGEACVRNGARDTCWVCGNICLGRAEGQVSRGSAFLVDEAVERKASSSHAKT